MEIAFKILSVPNKPLSVMAACLAKANANFFTYPSHKCDGNDNKMVSIAIGFSQRDKVIITHRL
jgi:hypothetical protein